MFSVQDTETRQSRQKYLVVAGILLSCLVIAGMTFSKQNGDALQTAHSQFMERKDSPIHTDFDPSRVGEDNYCAPDNVKVSFVMHMLTNLYHISNNIQGTMHIQQNFINYYFDPNAHMFDPAGFFVGIHPHHWVYLGMFVAYQDKIAHIQPGSFSNGVVQVHGTNTHTVHGVTTVMNDVGYFTVTDACKISQSVMYLAPRPPQSLVSSRFEKYDANQDGELDYDEFVNAVADGSGWTVSKLLRMPFAQSKLKMLYSTAQQEFGEEKDGEKKFTKKSIEKLMDRYHWRQFIEKSKMGSALARYLKKSDDPFVFASVQARMDAEKKATDDNGLSASCVADDAVVRHSDGTVGLLGDVKVGDRIEVASDVFDMVMWIHNGDGKVKLLDVEFVDTENITTVGHLKLTWDHLVHINEKGIDRVIRAADLKVGKSLLQLGNGHFGLVTGVSRTQGSSRTIWMLNHEFFVADGVKTSSWTHSVRFMKMNVYSFANPIRMVVKAINLSPQAIERANRFVNLVIDPLVMGVFNSRIANYASSILA